jgi:hypothetical protein
LGECALWVTLGLALWLVPTASADSTFCLPGSEAGQCESPGGVAVDTSSAEAPSGHVYLADGKNNRIDVFDSSGAFLMAFGSGVADGTTNALQSCTSTCFKGISGSGKGQFSSPIWVAVDNNPASSSHHNVYVGTDNFRVQKFDSEGHFLRMFGKGVNSGTSGNADICTNAGFPTDVCNAGVSGSGSGQFSGDDDPVAVGPGGNVYVLDGGARVEKFGPEGQFLETVALPGEPARSSEFAVDSGANFYVYYPGEGRHIEKYNSSGTPLFALEVGTETNNLAIDDTNDHLFAEQRQAGAQSGVGYNISEYDSSGTILRRFGYGKIGQSLNGIARYHSTSGDVFVSEGPVGLKYLAFPPPGPVIAIGSVKPVFVGNVMATIKAEINPEGKATKFHLEYVKESTYLADIAAEGPSHGFDHAIRVPPGEGEDPSLGFEDIILHPSAIEVGCPNPATEANLPGSKCLVPETKYRYRYFAVNADGNGNSAVEGSPFETKPSLEIKAAWSTDVSTDAAKLHASVNPLGVPATGYFEYVDDAKFKASGFAEAAKVPAVPGKAPLSFGSSESVTSASTTLSALAPATTYHYRIVASNQFVSFTGAAHTFTTFALPVALPSPDPCANAQLRTGAGAFLPDCRAYEMVSPLDKNNGDVMVVSVAGISGLNQSASDGERLTFASLQSFGEPQGAPFTSQYLAERHPLGDAEQGWQTEAISAPQGLPVLGTSFSLQPQFKAFSPDLCSGWLRHISDPPLAPSAPPGFANLYRRYNCTEPPSFEAITEVPPPVVKAGDYKPQLQGLSADGSHAVYRADAKLTSDASSKLNANGEPVYQVYERSSVGELHLVSVLPNGTASEAENSTGTPSGRGEEDGRDHAVAGAVSADGSRVYWTAAPQKVSTPGVLYIRDKADQAQSKIAAGKCSEAAKACTYPVSGPVSSGNAQFWAASPDGSQALFTIVSGAQTGNLYRFDFASKTSTLIAGEVAGLLGASKDLSRTYLVSRENRAAGATAGKLNLYRYEGNAFSFIATLAGTDVDNGGSTPNPASKDPSKRTARVSEDGLHVAFMSSASPPSGYDNTDAASGEPDAEVYLYDASAEGGSGKLLCVSCNPSGERPSGRKIQVGSNGQPDLWGAAQIPTWQTMLYPGRPLSENGQRLFFESFEALDPRDTNGRQDVYEWEASGTGGCTEASSAFSQGAAGCIYLISSGESPQDSGFIDASTDGHDVFFATGSSLLVQDFGLVDVYDARVDGGFPPPPPQKPSCEGEACQSAPPPPGDVTPASGAIEGPSGNVPPAKHHTKPRCGKGKRTGKRAVPRHRKAHCRKRNHKGRAGR